MQLRAFYSFRGDGAEIPGEAPVAIDRAAASLLPARMKHHRDFFGIVDEAENTLQVRYDEHSADFWVEIPDQARRGSHGRRISVAELRTLIEALPTPIDPSSIPGLSFEPW